MSFSAQIKEELSKINNLANKELVKAECIGYLITNNTSIEKNKIRYSTENEYNINRFHKLLANLKIEYDIQIQGKTYTISLKKQEIELIEYADKKIQLRQEMIQTMDIKKEENRIKAFVRGAFLGGGSLNNPNNSYHLEIVFSTKQNAVIVSELIKQFGIQSKLLQRKKSYSVYIKDSEEISKFLAFIGANKAVLEFEEIRVVRDTRNNINRIVNCETANLNKTVNASVEQINSIIFLKQQNKFEELAETLKEIAQLRIENPEATLSELGTMLQNPLGKSGVNHRLKKICEIANEIRGDA